MERWFKAENNLREGERASRQVTSLKKEQKLLSDQKMFESVREEESLMDIDFSESGNAIDAKVAELERSFSEKMGGDEQTIREFRENEFRKGMIEYLRHKRAEECEGALAAAKLSYVSAIEREHKTILSQGRKEVSQHQDATDTERMIIGKLVSENPEIFVGAHLRELREYRDELSHGRLVETPYVKDQKRRVTGAIHAGTPIFIHGHLGSGKTELALAASRSYLANRSEETVQKTIDDDYAEWLRLHPRANTEEQEEMRKNIAEEARGPLIISGSKQTHQSEFFGHRTLSIREFFTEDKIGRLNECLERYGEWEQGNTKKSDEAKLLYKDGLLRAYFDEGTGTFSDFFMGPIYRAMKQGRPVIIDEADAIPHEVMITLNHFLTRKPGETVSVQQDSGEKIKIKRGFNVILTGNFPSEKDMDMYLGRQPMDAAFLSRLEKLEHKYLPQSEETNLESASAEERLKSEIFQVLLAKMMDRYGNMELPEGSAEKLWKLAVYAGRVQDIFSGKMADQETGESGIARDAIGREVLSLRHLDRIIDRWQNGDPRDGGNMRFELDHALFEGFIKQAGSDTERMALYKIGQEIGLFRTDQGWALASDIESGAGVARFEIESPHNKSGEKKWYGPRDTVELAFGLAPERTKWPEVKTEEVNTAETEAGMEQLAEYRAFLESFDQEIETYREGIEDECGAGCLVEAAPATI